MTESLRNALVECLLRIFAESFLLRVVIDEDFEQILVFYLILLVGVSLRLDQLNSRH